MPPKKKIAVAKDAQKEAQFKGLVAQLGNAGYVVRREKLKAGAGWKAISGSCRANGDKLIFVDPRLPQDEQILFLRARAELLGVTLVEAATAA